MNEYLVEGNLEQYFQEQCQLLNLTSEELELIREVNLIIEKYCDEIVEGFYDRVTLIPHLKNMIETFSSLDKLKKSFANHLTKMFTKHLNNNFIEERTIVALTHFAVRLDPCWYIGAMSHLHVLIHSFINKEIEEEKKAQKFCDIVTKLISFELQIIIEAYEKRALTKIEIHELTEQLKGYIS